MIDVKDALRFFEQGAEAIRGRIEAERVISELQAKREELAKLDAEIDKRRFRLSDLDAQIKEREGVAEQVKQFDAKHGKIVTLQGLDEKIAAKKAQLDEESR